jgi:hypothetical protein
MEQMTRRTILAMFLGLLVGLAVGYSPSVQPSSAPRAQLLMQQANQPNIAAPHIQSAPSPTLLLVAVVAGLVIAAPVFLITKIRTR